VVRLYRTNRDWQHWFVLIPSTGWVRFPAKIDGWAERQHVTMLSREHLHEVPLWLAFNTGLLEARESQDLGNVA
jgi:hypothetical protein